MEFIDGKSNEHFTMENSLKKGIHCKGNDCTRQRLVRNNSHPFLMTVVFIMIMQDCFKVQQRIELLCK